MPTLYALLLSCLTLLCLPILDGCRISRYAGCIVARPFTGRLFFPKRCRTFRRKLVLLACVRALPVLPRPFIGLCKSEGMEPFARSTPGFVALPDYTRTSFFGQDFFLVDISGGFITSSDSHQIMNTEDDDADEGESWKKEKKNLKNELDYHKKIIINTHYKTPFHCDKWRITENNSERIDVFHKETYFSLVLGERPYIEVYRCDEYGQLIMPPERIFDLGSYFNASN